jgi:uncharacterized membrane protein
MRRTRGERGAILPMVALLLSVLMGAAAMAVDLGQLRVGRVDMQSLADVVSLDLARQIDGRQTQVIEADLLWSRARAQSVERNAGTYGQPPTVTAELGTFDSTANLFTPTSGSAVPTAVRVTAITSVAFAFRSGGGTVARSAVAMSDSTACFMLGSYAAAVRSGESALLSSVLGQVDSSLDLGAVGYSGLLDANVNLTDVAARLGIGTVTQLASSTVAIKDLYLAMASVLQTGGNAADAAVLSQLAVSVATLGQVDVGKVLQADTATSRGVDATVNAIDVIAGSAMLFTGSHTITVPNLSTSVPGLLSTTSSLSVIEAPQLACSRANPTPMREAKTSQVAATVGGRLNDVAVPTIGVGIQAGSPAGKPVGLTLSLASATGHLIQVTCANPASAAPVSAHSITVATTSGLMAADLTVPLAVSGKIGVPALGLGLVSFTIGVDVKVSAASAAGQARSTTITVPPQQFDTAYSAGSGSLSLASGSVTRSGLTVTATLLGLPVTLPAETIDGILSAAVSTVVTPLVNQLDAGVVKPLANLTGTRIAGADVIALSKPHCSVPVLRQ